MAGPKRLVLDTSVVVYLLTPGPPRGQEGPWREAQDLLRIDKDQWELCLPAPALGEVLAGIPLARQDASEEIMSRIFLVLDYDRESAKVAGRIGLAALRGRKDSGKQAVKIDVEIIACAVRWGAVGICALDGDYKRILAAGKLDLEVGPPSRFTPPQQPLFRAEGGEE